MTRIGLGLSVVALLAGCALSGPGEIEATTFAEVGVTTVVSK